MKIIIMALTFLLSLTSYATDKPDWVKNPPKHDSNFKYYIGRASFAASEAIGISLATKDAYEQAHRENYGSSVKIQSESYETTNAVSAVTRISEDGQSVRFDEFEQEEVYIEEIDSKYNVWVLYKFSQRAIKNEQIRLKNLVPIKNDEPKFSIQGGDVDLKKGTIELITNPSGSTVYIDGERYGKTPLRLIGQLEIGEHQVRFDHPKYEIVEEKFIVIPNKVIRIEKTLIKATGLIFIKTNPSFANVLLNSIPIGVSPIDSVKVEAGVPIKIEISHAETEKLTQEVVVEKGISRTLDFNLPLRPSYVSVETNPSSATIELDGVIYKSPIQKITITPGKHKLKMTKNDFLDEYKEFSIKGGENKIIPTITLIPLSVEQKRLIEEPWKLELGVGIHNSNIAENKSSQYSFSLGIEKKFFNLFGIKFLYEIAHRGSNEEDKSTGSPNSQVQYFAIDKKEYGLSLPIYVYKSFYFMPEFGVGNSSLSVKTIKYDSDGISNNNNNNSAINYSQRQTFKGTFIGWESFELAKHAGWFFNVGIRSYSQIENFESVQPLIFRLGFYNSY